MMPILMACLQYLGIRFLDPLAGLGWRKLLQAPASHLLDHPRIGAAGVDQRQGLAAV